MKAEPLLPGPDGVLRHRFPAEQADVRPIDPAERDRWRRDIERRAAMVRGLSVEDAARKLYAEGLLGRAVLEVLGVEP